MHDRITAAMLAQAQTLRTADGFDADDDTEATILEAAAALLSMHDVEGISLDEWFGPRRLVQLAFEIIDEPWTNFYPNGA